MTNHHWESKRVVKIVKKSIPTGKGTKTLMVREWKKRKNRKN